MIKIIMIVFIIAGVTFLLLLAYSLCYMAGRDGRE